MALRLEDRDLVLAYQAGDDEAFAELVREYRPQLLGHARRKLGCPEAAEDAVQEALVRALRAMPRFNGNYLVGPWLHRILSNVCSDEGNRKRREHEKTERFASNDQALNPPSTTEAELGLEFADAELMDAVDNLSEQYREALMMRFVEELSYEEVAARAGVSEDNARARVSRARNAVRAALKLAAAMPVALIGLLRRGERAASAVAGHGSTAGSAAAQTSAAQSSVASAMPLLTEAAPVASRAAVAVANAATTGVPVVAKAAVGLGLATAVVTPTVDSPVHKATERVLPDSVVEVLTPLAVELPAPDAPVVVPAAAVPEAVETAPAVVESAPAAVETAPAVVETESAPAAVETESAPAVVETESVPAAAAVVVQEETAAPADEPQATAAVQAEPEEAAVATVTADDTSLTEDSSTTAAAGAASAVSGTESGGEVVDQQASEADTQAVIEPEVADKPKAAVVAKPVVTVVATSSVEGADLTFMPAGADRYDVAGTLSLTVTTTTTTTTDDGEIVETDTMNKSVAVVVPSTASLQAADAAVDERRFGALLVFAPGDDGTSAEMRLAARGTANADGSLAMTGFFTATGTESLPLAERGNLSGTLTLGSDGMPASLAITLTQ
ncbi:MAG: sigma-70 family RNA polymerase sigma factor [Acidimicrobiaceae bacterium]|nr:sigma-70 family RNA polymerase sigma factor [Acidimicrobiaceae bacterium]